MGVIVPADGCFVFEQFRLDPVSRTVNRNDVRVPMPARLFDTLLCLVVNHDRLVEQRELLETVWPGRNVDLASARRAVSSVREVLEAHGAPQSIIATVPGRGYRLGARVTFEPWESPAAGMRDPPPAQALVPAMDADAPRRRSWTLLAGLLCLCIGAAGLLWRSTWMDDGPADRRTPFSPPARTVAVLPFANLSGDAGEDNLADGLAEELIDKLGSVTPLQVAARMSSFAFKGRAVPIWEIARQLQVGAVLDGSVRRDGRRVRVTVTLVNGVTGYQLWSRSYDRDQGNVLSLEGDLAEAVIASLKVVLLGDETARLRLGDTASGPAFDAYLSGIAQLSEDDHASDRRAISAFTKAIVLDPGYALAYAQRARALTYLASDGEFPDPETTRRMFGVALQDAEKAVALAPALGMAHASLAFVLNCTLSDFRRVAAEYGRAMALSPGNVTILLGYARLQLQLGHTQAALEAAGHAATLDPLTPSTYRALARVLTFAGRYDDALLALDRARRLPPADPQEDRIALGHVETLKGDAAAAMRTCGGGLDLRDNVCLAWAYHRLGRVADAEAALAKVHAAAGDHAAYIFAAIYADWGRADDALIWLATAYRLRDPGLMDLKVTPLLAPLHQTALYRQIERDLDFPP